MFKRNFWLVLLFGLISFCEAYCSFKVICKFPFSSAHFYASGNWLSDSLVRNRDVKAIIYQIETMDTLIQQQKTNDDGVAIFYFDKWRNGVSVDTSNISRIDIEFSNTDRVIRIGEEIRFEPLKFESVEFKGRIEGIEIVLPMAVYTKIDTVGVGSYLYCFAIMTDLHIAEGKKKVLHYIGGEPYLLSDFGTEGYNDTDNDPNETTFAIENNENIVAKINWWKNSCGFPIKFVVCLGDITSTSERSEYQRAHKVLQELDLPYIPILGNHDTWPYVGQWSYWPPPPTGAYIQQSPSTVKIGEYFSNAFRDRYDSLTYFSPIPNFQYARECTIAVPSSESYRSYYLNSAFDYQGYHFICSDFNTRNEAALDGPGTSPCADVDKGQPWDYSWDWIHEEASSATTNKKKMVILNHHPLMEYTKFGIRFCFNNNGIMDIKDAGLKNNEPIATWFGGHLHPDYGHYYDTTMVSDDTVAFVYNLNQASKDGYLYLIFVYDSVKTDFAYTPSTFPLPVTVNFMPDYDYQGSYNAPRLYYWDFGDGTGKYDVLPPPGIEHIYHLYNNLDTIFKVTLTVTTENWRKVSCAKMIQVTASPYELQAEYIYEDAVKLVWEFDQPDKVLHYIVKRNEQIIGTPTTKYFIDTPNTGLQRGQTYNYRVIAKYKPEVGHEDSPPAKLDNVEVPWLNAPTLELVAELPPNEVHVSWVNNSQYSYKYRVDRWDDVYDWKTNYKTVYHPTTSFDDTALFYIHTNTELKQSMMQVIPLPGQMCENTPRACLLGLPIPG